MIDKSKVDWEYFENLWEATGDQYDYFELVKEIAPQKTKWQWDRDWQYTNINHEDFTTAKREFLIAINETY